MKASLSNLADAPPPPSLELPGEYLPAESEAPANLLVPVQLEEVAAATIMAALALITLANVITRYVVDFSFAFTEEYSMVLLVVLVLIGVSSAIAKNAHIRVTFFLERAAPRRRRQLEVTAQLAMLICLGVLVWYGARLTADARALDETSPGLGNPVWLYLMWVPILSALAGLRCLGVLWRLLRGTR